MDEHGHFHNHATWENVPARNDLVCLLLRVPKLQPETRQNHSTILLGRRQPHEPNAKPTIQLNTRQASSILSFFFSSTEQVCMVMEQKLTFEAAFLHATNHVLRIHFQFPRIGCAPSLTSAMLAFASEFANLVACGSLSACKSTCYTLPFFQHCLKSSSF